MTELSNWGRWGKDDQAGTINLITPAKRWRLYLDVAGRRYSRAKGGASPNRGARAAALHLGARDALKRRGSNRRLRSRQLHGLVPRQRDHASGRAQPFHLRRQNL